MSDVSKLSDTSPLYLGIDLGTSGCRIIAIDDLHHIHAKADFKYPHTQQQTPHEWWQAVQNVLTSLFKSINPQRVNAIAIDGTSSTVFFCDEFGEPLSDVMMYYDQRAQKQAKQLENNAPTDSIVLSPSSSLSKVLYLFEMQPPTQKFHIIDQASWIAGKLCQRFDFSDTNNILKMGYDAELKQWPSWVFSTLKEKNIPLTSLPHIYQPAEIISNVTSRIAEKLNLSPETKIVAGTTDSTAAFIASGANQLGQAVTSLGSSLVVKVISDTPITDSNKGVYSHPLGDYWLVGGASNSGGSVLRHYFSEDKIKQYTTELNPDFATGLNYYPLLKPGERFPINDPNLPPQFSPKAKTEALFFQAILEGIADIEHKAYRLIHQLGAPYPTTVISNGGGAINAAWNKIREHKLGVGVNKAKHTDAAYGSALLAARSNSK